MSHKARKHLQRVDPKLAFYIEKITLEERTPAQDLFVELCDTIVSQQLSGKAASTIFSRFKALFPSGKITPEQLLKLPDDKIRAAGCSWAKVKSLKDLAQKVHDNTVQLHMLNKMTDDQVKEHLIQIRGIGPWSAEMFLMFGLGREDVFSYGDLGLRKGLMKVHGLKKEPSPEQVEKIVKKWSPHRTYASRILWKSLEL